MSERPSCAAGGVGDDDGRPRGRRIEDLPWWIRGGRCAVGTLSVLAVLAVGSAATSRASQDAAPKAEAAKESAPVPAPPEIPKDSAPAGAMRAPNRRLTLLRGAEHALSVQREIQPRRRTREARGSHSIPGRQFETLTEEWEKAQGAPDKRLSSQTMVYTERVASVGRDGEVTDTIRRYDKVPRPAGRQQAPRPRVSRFAGLEIWYQRRPGDLPQIWSLSVGRSLLEQEYLEISQEAFVPQLMAFFKQAVHRVGDTWDIHPMVGQARVRRAARGRRL